MMVRQNWYPYADEPRSDAPAPLIGLEDLGHVTAPAGWCAPLQSRPSQTSFEVSVGKISPEAYEALTGEPFTDDGTE